MIGQVNPDKGYVHVFDEVTLDTILKNLNTVNDFVFYLERKERLITSGKLISAPGEEDLLAFYLSDIGPDGRNDFVVPENFDFVVIPEGEWESFQANPQRLAQLEADEISYAWDDIIERFNINILNDTQYKTTNRGMDSEWLVRLLAREPRTRRRLLSASFLDLHSKLGNQPFKVRIMEPSFPGDPHYVFMVMRRPHNISYEEYREVRLHCLQEYMHVLKLIYPDALDIVGIAVGPYGNDNSEDLLYIDARIWTEEDQRRAEAIQRETGYLSNERRHEGVVKTYPEPLSTTEVGVPVKGSSRNKPCPCNSGRKYKHCCGKAPK